MQSSVEGKIREIRRNTAMHKLLALVVALFMMCICGCETGAKFQGYSIVNDKPIMLDGEIYRPEGSGPFPAVVLLHGCAGLNDLPRIWAETLNDWGYVAFVVDSMGPRGGATSCNARSGGPGYVERGMDAYYAKAHLNKLPYVIRDKIGIMGFSHGGGTTVTALDIDNFEDLPAGVATPFKVGVAYYPWCFVDFKAVDAPLMVLMGTADDWHSEQNCRNNMPKPGETQNEVVYKAFEGAHHLFDWPGLDTTSMGHTVRYHPEAAAQAKKMTKAFLAKYLK